MNLGDQRVRRRISLTPMIDVVFLLLFFFMIAARFGADHGISFSSGTGQSDASSSPRLIDIFPESVALNGVSVASDALIGALAHLTSEASSVVILRPKEGTDLQRLIDVAEELRRAGYQNLALIE